MNKIKCFGLEGSAAVFPYTEEQKENAKQYIARYGLDWDTPIEEHPFYKDYLSKFKIDWTLSVSSDVLMTEKEKDLLTRLVVGSFSSSYSLSLTERWKAHQTEKSEIDLRISVDVDPIREDQKNSESVSKLGDDQIWRLFSIYINEQISLMLDLDDDDDIEDYQEEQQKRLRTYENKIKGISEGASQFNSLENILSRHDGVS